MESLRDLTAIARIDRDTGTKTLEVYREDSNGELREDELSPLQMHQFVRMGRFLRGVAESKRPDLTPITREVIVDCRRLRQGEAHRLHDWHIDAARDRHGLRIPGPAAGSFVLCNHLPTEVEVDGQIDTIQASAVTEITGLKHRSPHNKDSTQHRLWAQILFG